MTILIADDDVYIREGIVASIDWKSYGIDCVMQADNGQQALEIAQWLQPDIILTDIKMPRVNGIEFAEKMSEIKKDTRIIFISSYMEIEYLQSAIRLAVVDYISKPINLDNLRNTLEKTVEGLLRERTVMKDYEDAVNIRRQRYTIMLTLNELEETQVSDFEMVLEVGDIKEFYCMLVENDGKDIHHEITDTVQKNGYYCSVGTKRKDCYVVLIGKCESGIGGPLFIAQDIYKISSVLRIGFSKQAVSLRSVYDSYEKAFASLQRSFFKYEQGIYVFEHENLGKLESIDFNLVEQFEALLRNESKGVYEWIDTCKKDICDKNYSIEQVKSLYYSLLNVLIENFPSVSASMYFSHKEPIDPEQLWAILSKVVNINVLHNTLTEALRNRELEHNTGEISVVISGVVRYIKANYQNPDLSINELAEWAHLSPTYLNVCFKKEMKTTPKQYIIDMRIKKAKQMLKEKKYKMKEIAELCGFSDNGYFTKAFRKETGENPLSYQERVLK